MGWIECHGGDHSKQSNLLPCFSAFLLPCFAAFLLLCFSASLLLRFLLLCFCAFCFSAFLLFPASLHVCFSASLLLCFMAVYMHSFHRQINYRQKEDHFLLLFNLSMTTSISISISISISTYIYIYIYLYLYLFLYLYLYYTYANVYLSKRFALSSRWYSNPKPPLNQARIYSTPTLYKEILNPHDDNTQGNYCASLCLNLPSTCFQGACRVAYTPWASHSTQHLACDNRCFQCALGGGAAPALPPNPLLPFFLFKPENLHA